MKRILLIMAVCLSCAGMAKAQSYGNEMRQIYSINWQSNVPVGSSRDFISNATVEGMNINWAYFVTPNLAVGLDIGYNNYHEKFSQRVYRPNENTAINAAQYRYTQVFPIKAQAKWFFMPNNFIKPYAGLGIGALSAGQHIVIQDFDAWDNNWGFLMSPEIGVLIPFGYDKNWGANITAGYNWSTNQSTVGGIKVDDRHSFYFNVGLYLAIF
jgi:outer membrane protein W